MRCWPPAASENERSLCLHLCIHLCLSVYLAICVCVSVKTIQRGYIQSIWSVCESASRTTKSDATKCAKAARPLLESAAAAGPSPARASLWRARFGVDSSTESTQSEPSSEDSDSDELPYAPAASRRSRRRFLRRRRRLCIVPAVVKNIWSICTGTLVRCPSYAASNQSLDASLWMSGAVCVSLRACVPVCLSVCSVCSVCHSHCLRP